jgi:tRNA U34 5-methylaminomethyl-2-thiouridine-forming methyltransferase MnmC
MKHQLSQHEWVTTEDGSLTLYSKQFGEACHSTSGAKSETILHYVKGCKVLERVSEIDQFMILEVGFGTGLGFELTKETLKETKTSWHFLSLELDQDLILWWLKDKQYQLIDGYIFEVYEKNFTLTILSGDARISLPKYLKKHPTFFHAIYQDAFSPKKNPTLWTREWFRLLKEHSSKDVILSTYSSSSSIRKALVEEGWILSKGDKFGPKRSSTRARLLGRSDEDILLHLERSPVKALSDDNISDYLKK